MRCLNKLFCLLLLLMAPCLLSAQEVDTTVSSLDSFANVAEGPATTTVEPEAAETEEEKEIPIIYNSQQPTDAQWRSVTSDKDFSYKDQQEYEEEKETPPSKPSPFLLFIARVLQFFASTAGHIVLWGLLALIVGYILYRVLSGEGKRLFAKRSESMAEAPGAIVSEEDLLSGNWEHHLQKAIAGGDTRGAIRYSYLLLLQLLQHRDLIQYRQDKTNTEYYRELANTDFRQPFRDLSRQYEFTWYGNFLPSEAVFSTYMQTFNNIKSKIGSR